MKKIVFMFLLLCPTIVMAITQESPRTSVKKITSYSELGGGDIIIQLDKNGNQCNSGYWLRKSDPGFRISYELLVLAFKAGNNSIVVEGNTLRLWAGSSLGVYCHVSNVQLFN